MHRFTNDSTELIVWGHDYLPPANQRNVIFWNAFLPREPPADWYSLPDIVTRDRTTLRSRYQKLIHEIGVNLLSQPIRVRKFMIRQKLNYWWLLTPADYSLDEDSTAYRVVRLMVLVDLLSAMGYRTMNAVGTDFRTTGLLRSIAKSMDMDFHSTSQRLRFPRRASLRRLVPFLPALAALLRHLRYVRLRSPTHPGPSEVDHGIVLVDFLTYPDSSHNREEYRSQYWNDLVQLLEDQKATVTWLHMYPEHISKSTSARYGGLIEKSVQGSSTQWHVLLHDYLTWTVLFKSLRDYLKFCRLGLAILKGRELFALQDSQIPLWHAVVDNLMDNLFGRGAFLLSVSINLFEEFAESLPYQSGGIYLFENQPWEMAFLQAWRNAGHGHVLGVSHTSMLYWDTRYFKDPQDTWHLDESTQMPWPDQVVVNGQLMISACLQGNYPMERLVRAEALRYLAWRPTPYPAKNSDVCEFLICGDYHIGTTQKMIKMLRDAVNRLGIPASLTFRPHPVQLGLYSSLPEGVKLSQHKSLQHAIRSCNIVVTGPTSSTAIEALGSGKQSIAILDAKLFVTNPLIDVAGVHFATSTDSLVEILGKLNESNGVSGHALSEFFFLNPNLPMWKELLLHLS